MKRKNNFGRRKIDIKLIRSKSARNVAFSKCTSGLFKKAEEMCILTGCEMAIVVVSQANHVYSFGHPSVESVKQMFFDQYQLPVVEPVGELVTLGLNQVYAEARKQLNLEKKRAKELAKRGENMPFWAKTPIHELSIKQLKEAKEGMERLKEEVQKKIAERSESGSGISASKDENDTGFDLNFAPDDEI